MAEDIDKILDEFDAGQNHLEESANFKPRYNIILLM